MKIYVASSWKNPHQPMVVQLLREAGHEVYDFRNPPHGLGGFSWSQLDPKWESWTREEYRKNLLNSQIAALGFTSDFRAMRWADACVMVLPCGNSAHTEMGYFTGVNKRSVIYMTSDKFSPDLMYLQADAICVNFQEVLKALE